MVEPLKNGNYTYLPVVYAAGSGIQTVDRIDELIDILEEQYG